MPIDPERLGLQTFSLRGFQGEEIVRQVKACGISRVELCTMQFDIATPGSADAVLDAYRAHGIAIDALGVHGCGSPHDEAMFSFARRCGARTIGVDFEPTFSTAPFRAAERLAERHDVRLAIHNHGGYHWLGSAQMLQHVLAHTSERIGVCLDTAWAMHAGEDPIAMLRRLGKRVYGLHIKDFAFDRSGRVRDVVVGQGSLDLGVLSAVLDEIGFDGYAALEYEGEPENPGPAIRDCVAAVKELVHA